ncbi:MAG: 3-dehydroquinate synthase [Planctomycetota bacterium]|nr:3-dehydroquinate synthase [Planctomycetota bacterium]MDA1261663.1 3-dehydroquinate synthase [Planctomycetota bacterium]
MSFDRSFHVELRHRVRFTQDVFSPENATLASACCDTLQRRVIAFIDSGVHQAHPNIGERLANYLGARAKIGDQVPELKMVEVVNGGEGAKNSIDVCEQVMAATDRYGIDRKSFVLAIGGGAVLDAVGLGATLAHRGVRLIRMPTTTLAMDDAAMGVKNGINKFGKKNFSGTFAVPWAVVADEQFLTTLTDQQFLCGFSEAIKIGCLKDPSLFNLIEQNASKIIARDLAISMAIIKRSAQLHLDHITQSGDAFEIHEARPLDFGHWAAHKLESMSTYEIAHGDAVAIGIALDCEYAVRMKMLPQADSNRIIASLKALRLPTWHPLLLQTDQLLRGLEEFREHLGGRMNITLLKSIGDSTEVHQMDSAVVAASVKALAP